MSTENLTEVTFQFFSIKFTPLKSFESNLRSNDILNNVITYISRKLLQDKEGHLIDRHEERQNSSRELYINRAIIIPKEKRIRCSIALLRKGREPLIKPKEDYKLVPITDLGSIAEETHFFIDYSKNYALICCEYNHYGPRMTDIEYYFRNVAHKVLRQSKATEVNAYLEAPIDETLNNLKNVLNIEIKVQPKNLLQLDRDVLNKYYSGINNLGNVLQPKFIRLEAYFQSPGSKSKALNTSANNMCREMLRRFQGRAFNIDAFEAFIFKYEDKDGKEEIFNLLNGKKEIKINIDYSKIQKSRDWYQLIKLDFDNFILSL
ncbi:hypothetical protein [Sphingobacterium anhuiense]|uniref:Uncharacterized protein n=1 Tax=Sphingobacterium anhuiense TaxID=493780 RepID=A0ABW5YWD5_9SPHI